MANLIREDVAYQGNYKSALPQHQKKDGSFVVTGENNPLPALVLQSDVMVPMDVQSRYSQTIQTHNAVSVANGVGSGSVFIDTNGFNDIAFTIANDATTATSIDVTWSHDGLSTHGVEYGIIPGTPRYKAISLPTKARFVKLTITNTDAAAHTISAWAFLKA